MSELWSYKGSPSGVDEMRRNEVTLFMNKFADKVVSKAKDFAPYSTAPNRKDGDHFKDSIKQKRDGDSWLVGSDVPHAIYVELDTRKHDIRPRNKKFLRFEVGGDVVFTKKTVKHPGTKGQHVLTKALDEEMKGLR